MKEIVIDRSKWRTGSFGCNKTGLGDTQLINDEGYKCCLGFITCAYKKKAGGFGRPSHTCNIIPKLTTKDVDGNIVDTHLTKRAIVINDNYHTTPQKKEKQLKELFKGVFKLKFVGKYKA